MTRTQLDTICAAIRAMKARSEKLESVKGQIEELQEQAKLQSTKALYQVILDLFE